MYKRLHLLFLLLTTVISSFGQHKVNVVVEKFHATDHYTSSDVSALRSKVIEALAKTQRVNIFEESSTLKPQGDDFMLLCGYLEEPKVNSRQSELDGKRYTMHEAEVTYNIWVSDPKTGKVKVAYQFNTSGSDLDGVSNAINSACRLCQLSMNKFVEAAFPLGGSIIALDEVDDDEAKSVYIDRGSLNGIKKGLKMDVMIMQDVAGTPTPKVIGTLTAKEVTDSRTLCSVNEGEKKIKENFDASVQMTIRSRVKKGFFKTIGNVMEGLGSSSILSTRTGFPLSAESMAALERDFGTSATASPVSGSSAAASSLSGSSAAASPVSKSSSFVCLDFATDKKGNKVPEPYHNWNGKMDDVRSYMKNAGYEEDSEDGSLVFQNKDYDGLCMVMYMFMNNKLFTASATIGSADKAATLEWMKSHYKFVKSDNKGMSDSHTFKSRDNKTIISVNFMSINGAQPHVSILYQNNN